MLGFKGSIFNWDTILSSNIKAVVEGVKHIDVNLRSHFFMSAYMMDILCSQHTFGKIKWSWNPTDAPIHVYATNYGSLNTIETMKVSAMIFLSHYTRY